MLRAHYREIPKLQAGRPKKGEKDNASKKGRKEEKERKKKK